MRDSLPLRRAVRQAHRAVPRADGASRRREAQDRRLVSPLGALPVIPVPQPAAKGALAGAGGAASPARSGCRAAGPATAVAAAAAAARGHATTPAAAREAAA